MQIYLAPMEGLTTFVYRNALQHYYGGIDKYFTPFIASKKLNYKEINEIDPEHNRGIALVPQILTNRSETFLAIAEQIAEYGYTEVNLNLGCPSGTVVSRKRGAGFLSVPWLLDDFLEEIFQKCPLKISVKTRIGVVSRDEWEDLLKIYVKYPMTELIIHPRLQREFYSGTPHPEAFRLAQESLPMPLIYNGDIFSEESLQRLQEQIPCPDRIMLGRGVLSNPQLPRLLTASDTASAETHPRKKSSASEQMPETEDIKIFRSFHDEILEGYTGIMSGDQPVLFRMKELWGYMRSYIPLDDRQLKKIQKTTRLSEYKILIRSLLT